MKKDTATFLLNLLNAQQLSIGAPDFKEVASLVLEAKRELVAIIDDNLEGEGEAEA